MTITVEYLIQIGIGPAPAKQFAETLAKACERFEINTDKRLAMFLAQAMHESANFTQLEENLYYSKAERIRQVFPGSVRTMEDAATLTRNPQALANRVYAGRMGNGDCASGDGWKYRGRGIFQLTGRNSYQRAQTFLGLPYVDEPGLVAQTYGACMTAAHYWHDNGGNECADHGDIMGATRIINGPALMGLAERTDRYIDVLEAMA